MNLISFDTLWRGGEGKTSYNFPSEKKRIPWFESFLQQGDSFPFAHFLFLIGKQYVSEGEMICF